jgi:hypothetical protein
MRDKVIKEKEINIVIKILYSPLKIKSVFTTILVFTNKSVRVLMLNAHATIKVCTML